MGEKANDEEFVYRLLVEPDEAALVRFALELLIADEAHESEIRALARDVLNELRSQLASAPALVTSTQTSSEEPVSSSFTLTVPLTPPQMKITHTAVKLLLDDTQREQRTERRLLWSVLGKLPDEHAVRAIELD